MSSLSIFMAGIVVSMFTGYGAYIIGLQEDVDRQARLDKADGQTKAR